MKPRIEESSQSKSVQFVPAYNGATLCEYNALWVGQNLEEMRADSSSHLTAILIYTKTKVSYCVDSLKMEDM